MENSDMVFVCGLLNEFKNRDFRVGETFSIDEFDTDIFERMGDIYGGSWADLFEIIKEAMLSAGWVEEFDIYLIITKKWGKINA